MRFNTNNQILAKNEDIRMIRDNTLSLRIMADRNVGMDFSDCRAYMQVKKRLTNSDAEIPVLTLTSDAQDIVYILATETEEAYFQLAKHYGFIDFEPGKYYYDFYIVNVYGKAITYQRGKFFLEANVTEGDINQKIVIEESFFHNILRAAIVPLYSFMEILYMKHSLKYTRILKNAVSSMANTWSYKEYKSTEKDNCAFTNEINYRKII